MAASYSRELMVSIPHEILVDIETTGLDASNDGIIVFGYIESNHLRIMSRTSEDEKPFIAQIAKLVPTLPRPFMPIISRLRGDFLKLRE